MASGKNLQPLCGGWCEQEPGEIKCSCDEVFCTKCFQKHLQRLPTHKKAPSLSFERAWAWVSGTVSTLTDDLSRQAQFQKDEGAKWFGLVVEKSGADRIISIIETPRFANLVEDSTHYSSKSPIRQYPSIVSFVGDTGAGKSTLVRSLVQHATKSQVYDELEAPIPGSNSGSAAFQPTTGEVNLYPDPATFGTQNPRFYADCEGMLGAEPVAAQHQKVWWKYGRRYLIEERDGKRIDRSTAVKTIYPKFLYIFSDVICMVTRNQKSWADTAVRLLEWSTVGAYNAVNQYALPALIIILNAPAVEDQRWVSEDQDQATEDFFKSVEQEIVENETLREMAKKKGDKTMKELFLRNFSSVYVHYIPLKGYLRLGTSDVILRQVSRLNKRIHIDCARVQTARAESWTRFDSRQMSRVFDFAFRHLTSGSLAPFDFSACRRQTAIPDTTEGHIAEFLKRSLSGRVETNFEYATRVIASCLVRNSLRTEGVDVVHSPSTIFNTDVRQICIRAIDSFLHDGLQCVYVHPSTGIKCVNTKAGHAKGHQSEDGDHIEDGLFKSGDFSSSAFEQAIEENVKSFLKELNSTNMDRGERNRVSIKNHRTTLASARDNSFWSIDPSARNTKRNLPGTRFSGQPAIAFSMLLMDALINFWRKEKVTSTCFACLFGRPEYHLPCGHLLCLDCVRDLDDSDESEKYPGVIVHKECPFCPTSTLVVLDNEHSWPWRIPVNAKLSGLRVLSLDGGGVRGIVELAVLKRLETQIGLQLPLGEFFDLIVGTSAGGMIALGLGVHRWDADQCIAKFRDLCHNGFKTNPLTKSMYFGWISRWLHGSIYETKALESSMKAVYGSERLFGLHRGTGDKLNTLTRVAVTTTVNSECKLFANYNCGDTKDHLNSNTDTWEAARCTSAAPMYFSAYRSPAVGSECRDGGLRDNNPIQIAIDESKEIWGTNAIFDVILSVGSGSAAKAPTAPMSAGLIPSWIYALLQALIANMNGEAAWERFQRSADRVIRSRSYRLNIFFKGRKEPALDDIGLIDSMQKEAERFNFYSTLRGMDAGARHSSARDEIEKLALLLRASLYFFELQSITYSDDRSVAIVKGSICCRLDPESDAAAILLSRTTGFRVKDGIINLPREAKLCPFAFEVSFQQQLQLESAPLPIDVHFSGGSFASISGFPRSLKELRDIYGE